MTGLAWHRRIGALFLGVAFALIASPAQAGGPQVLCVTDVDPGPTPSCSGQPCSQVHTTIDGALSAAEALPNQGGDRPEVWICSGLELPDSSTPYVDSLVIDNRDGVYGEPLSLILKRPLCPDPESGPSQPVVEVVTDGSVFLRGPVVDMTATGPCEGSSRPGVSTWGGGDVGHIDMDIQGWSGYGVANGIAGTPVDLLVGEGAILNGEGAAVRSTTSLTVNEMEIAGNRTAGAVGLLWSSSSVSAASSPKATDTAASTPVSRWSPSPCSLLSRRASGCLRPASPSRPRRCCGAWPPGSR
ncbi:MAG: hypothetical protein GY898_25830 [Proteobacteria bacterium]|nr:hypothetical protein [Pseudomonadota bacterium]